MVNLERYLPIGKENAIHQKDMAHNIGVTPATIKIMVRDARKKGAQILSGNCGYWIAKDDFEKKELVEIMRKKALTLSENARLINNTIGRINAPKSLENAVQDTSKKANIE